VVGRDDAPDAGVCAITRPGDRLRAAAAHVFDADTMDRLIDPAVADLQAEYAEASRAGLTWRRRWVRFAGYIAFAKVAVRPMRVFLAATLVATMLLMVPPYLQAARYTSAGFVYMLPSSLVIAIPVALTIALAWSRPARASGRWLRRVVVAGMVCSALCFVTLAWWTPSANQAFRVSMARELGGPADPPRRLSELTIGELRQQVNSWTAARAEWSELALTYYIHWAFQCASLSLALLMIALHRRGVRRRLLLFSAIPIVFGYYVVMFTGRYYAVGWGGGGLPASVAAWMPNAVVILIAFAVSALGAPQGAAE
jgi:hypothetical protein